MFVNSWKHVRWIKSFSFFMPFFVAAETVLPKKLVKCYGLVNTRQATNHMLLSSRKPRGCDAYGYILLLEDHCVSVLRGQTVTGPRFGCVNAPCKEDLPAESCKVDRKKLVLAQVEVRKRSLKNKKEKPTIMGYKGKNPFGGVQKMRAPILTNY